LRRDHEIGSVERGMTADLLVVNGNPAVDISDTRHVVHVIKGGKLVNREALKLQNTPGE
jgi:imidazolonepropionase-like amidohydrolase